MSSPHSRIAWYDSPRKKVNSFRISSSVKSWLGPQILLKIGWKKWIFLVKLLCRNHLNQIVYLSATSWILSLFFDSQTTTDGKLVVQSRYELSTTKLIALLWNASNADMIKNADPIHDKMMANNQKSRSKNEISSSMRNLTPCNDEFFMYSFIISLQRPISTVFFFSICASELKIRPLLSFHLQFLSIHFFPISWISNPKMKSKPKMSIYYKFPNEKEREKRQNLW